jgi:hypothetical protein
MFAIRSSVRECLAPRVTLHEGKHLGGILQYPGKIMRCTALKHTALRIEAFPLRLKHTPNAIMHGYS